MTESDTRTVRSISGSARGTWRASVDAALSLAPAGARFTLLHVTPTEVPDAARGAYAGLFGRGHRAGDDPGARLEKMAATSAADLLEAAAGRLGRRCWRLEIQGRPERAVVAASVDADLLVVARDGDENGSARRAWARSPGSSWITRPARSCSSGRSPRPTSPPFPRRHITLPRRTAELEKPGHDARLLVASPSPNVAKRGWLTWRK